MKNKSLIYLFGALVLLLVIYLIVNSARDVTQKSVAFIKADTTKIDGFAIRNQTGAFKLKKSSDQWRVVEPVDYPADPRFTADLISKIASVEMESVVSEDTSKYSQFQVGDSGAELTVFQGSKTVAHLIVGKPTDTRSHTYVRKVGDQKIYLVKGIFTGQLSRQVRDWRDKNVINLEREAVSRLDFTTPKGSFSLVRVDSTRWNILNGELESPAKQTEVDHSLSAVSKLRCFDFVDGDTVKLVDYAQAEGRVTINTTSGEIFKLSLIAQDPEKNRYLIKKDGVDGTLFIVYKGTALALIKNPEDFDPNKKEDAPPPAKMPPMPRPKGMKI
ncbi:MAG: DUF4340 domain-containing protein [bacterium]|nr:DUF4340 domain-containing protein [bacterium]